MAVEKVVVHDIELLEFFLQTLIVKRDSIETLYEDLGAEVESQATNWQDPQYDNLKTQVAAYCSSSAAQLDELDGAITYISSLVSKLKGL